MTREQALRDVQTRLQEAGFPARQAEIEARHLLEAVTRRQGVRFWLERHRELSPVERERLQTALSRRLTGEPLQLVLGSAVFFGLELRVVPGVLIPRPETERLVELALAQLPPQPGLRVLDVGTGSGAIALALKHERPDLEMHASDPSEAALRLARANARRLALEVTLHAAPYTAGLRGLDLIVSNPPYLPEGYRAQAPPELAWEPEEALYAGPEGLDVARPLLREARDALRPGGRLLIELDPGRVHALAAEARTLGFAAVDVEADLAGRPRFLRARR